MCDILPSKVVQPNGLLRFHLNRVRLSKGHYPDFTRRLDHHITTKEFCATGTNSQNTLTQRADGKITRRTKCNFSLVTRLKSSPIEWWHPGIYLFMLTTLCLERSSSKWWMRVLFESRLSFLGLLSPGKATKKLCKRFLSQKHTSFP